MAYFIAVGPSRPPAGTAKPNDKAAVDGAVRMSPAVWMWVAAIALAGAALRIACARGDLWLDEIWSYRLLDIQSSPAGILLALPHDNNHVLNTLWLSLVGPLAPPLVARLPAVGFGALSILVAGHFGARRSAACGIATAAIFAFSPIFVQYGSEARGYAGLVLGILLALDALEACLATAATPGRLAAFALAITFGAFSHLLMVEAAVLLCAAAALRMVLRHGLTRKALAKAAAIWVAAGAGVLLPLGCFVFAVLTHGLWTGVVHPYSPGALSYGLARAIGATVGLPDTAGVLAASGITVAATALCCAAALATLPRERAVMPALAIFSFPVLAAVLHMPNANFARFHIVTVVALALLAAEVGAQAWRRGRASRTVALIAMLAFALGCVTDRARFLVAQRGHYADAVAFMTRAGPATYVAEPAALSGVTDAVIRWYDGARHLTRGVASGCEGPDWLVVAADPDVFTAAPSRRALGDAACGRSYALRATFPAYGLSGFVWLIYGPQG